MAIPAAPQPVGGSSMGAQPHRWSIRTAAVSPDDLLEIRCRFIILAREIRCQFIILARKDEPTPDFPRPSPTGLRARWAGGLMVLGTTKCLHETWDGRFSSASRSPWSLRRAQWPSGRIGLPMATSLSYPSD